MESTGYSSNNILQLTHQPLLWYLVSALITIYLVKRFMKFKQICDIMAKIPGPPNHFLLGNAILVLYLDKFNFKYGTYVLLFQMGTAINLLFGKYRICKMWLGFKPFVILFTPEAVETVLTNQNLTIKADEYTFLKPWLGEGLVTSNGKKWRTRRKMLTPTFHFSILQDFLPIMNEHCVQLIDKLYSLSISQPSNRFRKLDKYLYNDQQINQSITCTDDEQNKIHDILPIITLCTLDIICETAMGTKLNLQKQETEYVQCIQEVEKFFLWRLTRPWLWFDSIYRWTNDWKANERCLNVMRKFTISVIDKRKKIWLNYLEQYASNQPQILSKHQPNAGGESIYETNYAPKSNNGSIYSSNNNYTAEEKQINEDEKFQNFFRGTKTRLAFLDLLLREHFNDPKNFTTEDVKEEADTFMFAGHDTTSGAISFCIYMLGRYPEIQQKVRDEVDAIIDKIESPCTCKHKITFSFEHLKEMKYLDCVLKEVQRIYPTAPFFGRRVTKEIQTNGYTIPVGSTVAIFTYAMHRNPEFFPDPLKFDPDRFLPENVAKRHPYSFIPFSAGARNCIGQKFSQLEQKLVMAKLIRNFYFESVDAEDKLILVGEMILKPKTGLRMKIYRRFSEKDRYCSNCFEKESRPFDMEEVSSRNL